MFGTNLQRPELTVDLWIPVAVYKNRRINALDALERLEVNHYTYTYLLVSIFFP